MKKIVLIDGNNLMFRSYFATAYSGNVMKNSKDFPTNALYGFATMINKIITEEQPNYIAVAFDIGKNFRKREYDFYKEGRAKTPDDLKIQMPVARKLLDAMGIKYLELEPYEADDIIGTLVKKISLDEDFDATIISSDRDLLQLINFETDIKLLKQSGYIRYNETSFKETYGINPIKIIDLKALMGDVSDNIPGVKGIGEKTALKLLVEYGSLEGVYENLENIPLSTRNKLINDHDNAFMSQKLSTIYQDVPLNIELEALKYNGMNYQALRDLYEELDFYSLIKNLAIPKQKLDIKYITVNDEINVVTQNKIALNIEVNDENYTSASFIGAAITDGNYLYYFPKEALPRLKEVIKGKEIITYDHKKNMYVLDTLEEATDDLMISSYLLNYNVKDDISLLASHFNEAIENLALTIKNSKYEEVIKNICMRALFIWKYNDQLIKELNENNLIELYRNIEMPLIKVLVKMEKEGVKVDRNVLQKQSENVSIKLENLTEKIYNLAGVKFNISSTKQLGEILFDKMQIAKGKKNKTGYKTDVTTLEKLQDEHPIINLILEYRNLAKLKSTYLEGLQNYIDNEEKIHTIFKQTIARTGRLSSVDPNLQNIPARDEFGRKIREAFLPVNDVFLSCDYSQIELRVLAHVTNCQKMIETFQNDGDIHATVASDINNVPLELVTKEMRSKAKAVIFGIVYGISGFGLKENLHINKAEADHFIAKYYEMYPEVKEYMNREIEFAKQNGYVKTLFNRIRKIDEINASNYMVRQSGERMAINTPIQGTAADIIKTAMVEVSKAFEEHHFQSKLVLQVHDELIFDIKKEELDQIIHIVKNIMENVIELKVPLKVSNDTGENWYETK